MIFLKRKTDEEKQTQSVLVDLVERSCLLMTNNPNTQHYGNTDNPDSGYHKGYYQLIICEFR